MSTLGDSSARLDVPSTDDSMQLSPDMDHNQNAGEDIEIDFDLDEVMSEDCEDDIMEEQPDDMVKQDLIRNEDQDIEYDDEMADDDRSDLISLGDDPLLDEDLKDAEPSSLDEDLYDSNFTTNPKVQPNSRDVEVEDVPGAEVSAQSNAAETEEYYQESFDVLSEDQQLVLEESLQPITKPPQVSHQGDHPRNQSQPANLLHQDPEEGKHAEEVEKPISEDGSSQESARQLNNHVSGADQNVEERYPSEIRNLEPGAATATVTEQEASTHRNEPPDKEVQASSEDINQEYENHDNVPNDNPNAAEPMHSIVVVYQGNEMSLFPPINHDFDESSTYLLDDETYAIESLSNLFGHCRDVLADSIGSEEELEITIPDLALVINETSATSVTTTLSQILDMFIQLCYGDGVDTPDPLYIELNTHYRLALRLDYLLSASLEGKGLSQLQFLSGHEDLNADDKIVQETETRMQEQVDNAEQPSREGLISTDTIADDRPSQPENSAAKSSDDQDSKGTPPDSGDDAGHPSKGEEPSILVTKKAKDPDCRNPSTSTESDRVQAQKDSIILQQVRSENDDIIDYSDEELDIDDSTGSSTLQGDNQDDKIEDPPTAPAASRDNHSHGSIYEGLAESASIGTPRTVGQPNAENPKEDINKGSRKAQEGHQRDELDQGKPDDLDDPIDYDKEDTQTVNFTFSKKQSRDVKGGYVPIVEAIGTHDTYPPSANHSTYDTGDGDAFNGNTSDIDFELEDDEDFSEHVTTHDPNTISKINDINGDEQELSIADTTKQVGQQNQKALTDRDTRLSAPPSEASETFDRIVNEDDEITIPEHVDTDPRPMDSPGTLKRLRDDHSEDNVLINAIPDSKRIRAI